jgi:hypothetical protein
MIVNWTDAGRNVHIVAKVMVVWVHVGMAFRSVSVVVVYRCGLRFGLALVVVSPLRSRIVRCTGSTTRIAGLSCGVALSGRGGGG